MKYIYSSSSCAFRMKQGLRSSKRQLGGIKQVPTNNTEHSCFTTVNSNAANGPQPCRLHLPKLSTEAGSLRRKRKVWGNRGGVFNQNVHETGDDRWNFSCIDDPY